MLQEDYFVLERENNDDYPLLSWDESSDGFGLGEHNDNAKSVKFHIAEPISANFTLVDYHEAPDPVISERLQSVLSPLSVYGVQFVPAIISDLKKPFHDPSNYYLIHVWNRIACLDKRKSQIRSNKAGTRIFSIDQLVLDEASLEKIELPARLMFYLSEKTSVLLIHKDIKEIIQAIEPKGCRFFKVSEWNTSSSFA
jgi:hypothetical protein